MSPVYMEQVADSVLFDLCSNHKLNDYEANY